MPLYRALPSVDACLKALETLFPSVPHAVLTAHVRRELDELRSGIREGRITDVEELALPALISRLGSAVDKAERPRLRRVINGAGVVVHTNLGRSVLAREAQEAVKLAAEGYCNLEFDLATGERGHRMDLVEGLLCDITGAEAALVVNNNAAAVLLMLDTLCKGGEVVISRGQLVEVGGSFRIPDVMARSGAVLREVGATNRTHLADYAEALNESTRALLWVHPSNYRIIGFHSAVPARELSDFAHAHGLPMLEDLGSGSLIDLSPWGLHDEPTVPEVVRSGVDVVTFSGDKVLGGPQAGIIVGKKEYISRMKRNQLLRALRCDKLTLAALEATLRRLTMRPDELQSRAETLCGLLRPALERNGAPLAELQLRKDFSRVGGGSFPEQGMATTLVCVKPLTCSATELKERLLAVDIPVIGRLEGEYFMLDPRTLDDAEFETIAAMLAAALA